MLGLASVTGNDYFRVQGKIKYLIGESFARVIEIKITKSRETAMVFSLKGIF